MRLAASDVVGTCSRAPSTPAGKIVKITGVKSVHKTITVLCRGSNRLVCPASVTQHAVCYAQVIDEAERSIHDALCVVRSLVKEK